MRPGAAVAALRPRLSPAVARRLDRLSRGGHAFHRYAHHPLCDRYRAELIPLGHRARVCRGCAALALGFALGLWAGWLSRFLALPPGAWALAWMALGLGFWPASWGRAPKLLKRLIPGFAVAALAAHGPWPQTLAAVLAGAVGFWAYRWRGPDRSPCLDCPERTLEVCAGFRPMVRRERALQRLTRPLLAGLSGAVGAQARSAGARSAGAIDTRVLPPL